MSKCWQSKIRESNYKEDLILCGLSEEEAKELKISDFEFRPIDTNNKLECNRIKEFIERHEWLGKMSLYPTHRFACYYNNILAGVVVMDMPNSFSKLLGEDTKKIERLISRGACISWSPKGLASWLIMKSIRWMVDNTQYRVFTCYSDPEAGEVGTIYQACNFYYLGKNSGTSYMYADPNTPSKWFSDRSFRSRSAYKRYAKSLGIDWDSSWQDGDRILWENMPKDIEISLRQQEKVYRQSCLKKKQPAKGKYVYILGKDKRETKNLKRIFMGLNDMKEYEKRGREDNE